MKMHAFPSSPGTRQAGALTQDTPHADADPAQGMAALVLACVEEAFDAVPAAQASAFFRAVGKRLAGIETLEGVNDVSGLSVRVNALWYRMGWGEAEFAIGREAIIVRHRDAPVMAFVGAPPEGAEPVGLEQVAHWQTALGAVLEGAYDAWFRILGSGPVLQTQSHWSQTTLELRHGR